MSRSSGRVASVSSLGVTSEPTPSTIHDHNLLRKRNEVSFSAFAYIFSEAIQYCHRRAKDVNDLETRLNKMGRHIGVRVLELTVLREGKSAKREVKLKAMLHFVITQIWQVLFVKSADSVQISEEESNQYMIIDNSPLITKFVSVPKDISSLNCNALVAGILQAVFVSAGYPCSVTAHNHEIAEYPDRTVYVVKFNNLRRSVL